MTQNLNQSVETSEKRMPAKYNKKDEIPRDELVIQYAASWPREHLTAETMKAEVRWIAVVDNSYDTFIHSGNIH